MQQSARRASPCADRSSEPRQDPLPELSHPAGPDDLAAWSEAPGGGLEAARALLQANGSLPDPNDDPRTLTERWACLDGGLDEAAALVDEGSSLEEIESALPAIELRWAMRALTFTVEPDRIVFDGWVNPRKERAVETGGGDGPLTKKYGEMGKFGDRMVSWMDGQPDEYWQRCNTTDLQLQDAQRDKGKGKKKQKGAEPTVGSDAQEEADAFIYRFGLGRLTGHGFDKEAAGSITIRRQEKPWVYEPSTRPSAPKPSMKEEEQRKAPGYVFGTLETRESKLQDTLTRYTDQVWKGAEDGGAGRLMLVIGLNRIEPLEEGAVFAKPSLDVPFPCTIVPFTWNGGYHDGEEKDRRVGIEVVRKELKLLSANAQALVKKEFYSGRFDETSKMELVPYGALREEILPEMKQSTTALSKSCSPVYLHFGDPDAVDWRVNGSDTGVLAHMDGYLAQDKAPQMIAGGYNYGAYDENETDPRINAVRLGNEMDRAARRAISTILPSKCYPTEPNLFLKAFEEGDTSPKSEEGTGAYDLFANRKLFDENGRAKKLGAVMGPSNAEGRALRTNVFEAQKLRDEDFAYADATITTAPPGRVIESAKGTRPFKRLVGHTQSHAANNGIEFRTNKPKEYPKVQDEITKHFEQRVNSDATKRK